MNKVVVMSLSESKEYLIDKILEEIDESMQVEKITYISHLLEFDGLKILIPEKKVYLNSTLILLSNHEYGVLEYLTRHPGWIRSKEQIYEAVWKEEPINCADAVMWCISQLRKKIESDPKRPKYIHTVKGQGYKFEVLSEK